MERPASPASSEQAQLTAYLLDQLPDLEARQIEERYFADDSFFVLAGACEQELIRDYLRKRLSPEDTRSFENKYLTTPGLREKVEFCAAIMTVARALPAPRRAATAKRGNYWWLAAAAAIVGTLAVGVWQQIRIVNLEARLRQAESRNTVAAQSPPPNLPIFALSPALNRDGSAGPAVLRIPPGIASVQLSLEIEPGNEASEYRAVVTLPGGVEIWSGRVMGGGRRAVVTLPARVLPRGDYVLTLDSRAGKAHQTYAFRVE